MHCLSRLVGWQLCGLEFCDTWSFVHTRATGMHNTSIMENDCAHISFKIHGIEVFVWVLCWWWGLFGDWPNSYITASLQPMVTFEYQLTFRIGGF